VAGLWFSPVIPVSSTKKTDCHDITEILFKAALNIIVLIHPMYKLDLFVVKQNSRLKYISKIKLSKLSPY
jgi:hypothetical protein